VLLFVASNLKCIDFSNIVNQVFFNDSFSYIKILTFKYEIYISDVDKGGIEDSNSGGTFDGF